VQRGAADEDGEGEAAGDRARGDEDGDRERKHRSSRTSAACPNNHSAELADVQLRLKQLGAEDLDDEEYDRRLAELRAERDRIRELPIEPGRVDWIDTGETYARKWESLDSLGRNDWLRSVARAWVSRQGHMAALAAVGPMTIQDRPRVLVRQAGDITLSIILGSLSSLAPSALRAFPMASSPGERDTRLSLTHGCYSLNNKDYAGNGTSG
jgi:hypothetical protein